MFLINFVAFNARACARIRCVGCVGLHGWGAVGCAESWIVSKLAATLEQSALCKSEAQS